MSLRTDKYRDRDLYDDQEDNLPHVSMDELDDYLDLLYEGTGKSEKEKEEGLKAQIYGTSKILMLCRDVMNLEQLIQNATLMGALTRVLQEDFKKSADLTFNILKIFLSFSNFIEMHTLMANYRIGLLTMKALDYEIKRAEHREAEKAEKDKEYELEVERIKEEYCEDESLKARLDKLRRHREKDNIKLEFQIKKQNKVFFVGLHILLNLSENVTVERKMVNKNLVLYIESVLDRTFCDLLMLSLAFLRKLSIYEENKDIMRDRNIVSKLSKFISCSHQSVTLEALKLLFNLSFDVGIREQLVQGGLIPKLVSLLKIPAMRAKTLKLLYHLSVDDRCKSMFAYTECVPLVMGMIINFPKDTLTKELAGLAINLSHHPKNCELILANKGLNLLVDRLTSSSVRDVLLMKIIRNISCWTYKEQQEVENPEMSYKYRGLWSPHLRNFLDMANNADNHELLVEVVGLLANLTKLDLPANMTWLKILKEQNILNLISKLLVPGMCQNDLLLEVVLLVSTAVSEAQVCEILATSNIIGLLFQLWQEKTENEPEITLQLIVCFHKLFLCEASREEAMYSTRIVSEIIECLSHKNKAIRKAADSILEFVLEQDRQANGELGKLGDQIKKKRFNSYNSAWLQECSHLDSDSYARDDPYYRVGANSNSRFINDADDDDDDLEIDAAIDWKSHVRKPSSIPYQDTYNHDNDDNDDDDDDDNQSYYQDNRWKQKNEMNSKYQMDYDISRNYKEDN